MRTILVRFGWLMLLTPLCHGLLLSIEQAAGQSQPATSQTTKAETTKTEAAKPETAPAKTAEPIAPPVQRNAPIYQFRREHDPNGIGKFYLGREIAHVMGFAAANWLERPEREEEERISKLITALELKPGQVVADIGAGSGRISFLMAEQVGAEGKILAVDVQPQMLDLITQKIKATDTTNIETILGTAKSPKLPAEKVDLAIMVDVYHEFEFPYEMLLEISRSLKTGGRIAFVEYRLEDESVPIKLVHKMSQVQVKKEASLPELRLKWQQTIDVLPWQHIILFEKQAAPLPVPSK